MSWGFERGRRYNRREDIHGRYGGQQQGGIITPAKHKVVFIISGKRGLDYGYNDRQHPDGMIEYFGEGQKGDMTMTNGNKAIAEHVLNGKSLLFFEKEYPARHVMFRDELICEGWHNEQTPDSEGMLRNAIVFELRPLDSVVEVVEERVPAASGVPLNELKKRAFAAAKASVATSTTTRTIFQRSADVRDYVIARSQGVCEGCGKQAPFMRSGGVPYLEPHHIRRVSDGGPDDPRFVIALCPNCHRRVHSGVDGSAYNSDLLHRMKAIEVK